MKQIEATKDVNDFIRITGELSALRLKIEAMEARQKNKWGQIPQQYFIPKL